MTDTSRPLERSGRRGRRRLSPVQKYEAFVQVLTGEMTVVECADHWGVDRSTIMRPARSPSAALWTRWRRLVPGRAPAASTRSW